jgi:hypothetical protein
MHADADIILFFLWARENFADITEHMTPVNKHIVLIYDFKTNKLPTYNYRMQTSQIHICYNLISHNIFYMFWALRAHHQEVFATI